MFKTIWGVVGGTLCTWRPCWRGSTGGPTTPSRPVKTQYQNSIISRRIHKKISTGNCIYILVLYDICLYLIFSVCLSVCLLISNTACLKTHDISVIYTYSTVVYICTNISLFLNDCAFLNVFIHNSTKLFQPILFYFYEVWRCRICPS